jgi:pimeloyl-ACP methyl ester carboxylesterase
MPRAPVDECQIHAAIRPVIAALWAALMVAMPPAQAADDDGAPGLSRCRLEGVETDAWCGRLSRPLDPAQPAGTQIAIHYAVLPALARRKLPDPVFVFAGGPGQSAIDVAAPMSRTLGRFLNRRDVVLVDQRGTGRSAPLKCDPLSPLQPLSAQMDTQQQVQRLHRCRDQLAARAEGRLGYYTTTIAMADVDAVRRALGAERINAIGVSYGTRAVLEYMRQFPATVRRAVIDGVAPPDMRLPLSVSSDNQAAFDAVLAACTREPACSTRHPKLGGEWQALLASLPRDVTVAHPASGRSETVRLDRDTVLGMVRPTLYVPALASALPLAVSEAAAGRFEPLFGLSTALAGSAGSGMAEGMHFSVVCAEDMSDSATAAPKEVPSADFGDAFARLYTGVCGGWPRGVVPPAFYTLPPAPVPTLVLSGGADPVTPPRHGERVARALGANARHVVVPQAGHGVMMLPCMRDVVYRFIDAEHAADALAMEAGCATAVPRPPAFVAPAPAASASGAGR